MLRASTTSNRAVDPNEAMVASQQKHIADLVARNKTLEHTLSKLKAAVQEEKERAHDAVAQIEERWKAERAEWREGCDTLQIAHRVAHLRTAEEVDRVRVALLETKEALRKERLARMQRDYRLVMFQAKELDLEERNAQLERELEVATSEREEQVAEAEERAQETAAVLQARCNELADQLKELAQEQGNTLKEKEKAETTKRLERVSLQFETIKTSHQELERKYAESEANAASLRRQVEKWATLENRENADLENLRKARIELEVKVKQLEAEKAENEKQKSQQDALVEKLQKKVDKYKESWAAHSRRRKRRKTPIECRLSCRPWKSASRSSLASFRHESRRLRRCRRSFAMLSGRPRNQRQHDRPKSLQQDVLNQSSLRTMTLRCQTAHLRLPLRRNDRLLHHRPLKTTKTTSKRSIHLLRSRKARAKARGLPASSKTTRKTTRTSQRPRQKRSRHHRVRRSRRRRRANSNRPPQRTTATCKSSSPSGNQVRPTRENAKRARGMSTTRLSQQRSQRRRPLWPMRKR
ncbi:hypothetical protein GY45DRAFT_218864 [Cubamyces sp. BRFM 1775]|nr:hypothetical protein GY45DRAFT_218864 [Cubamyces sp. BRFM 1775]